MKKIIILLVMSLATTLLFAQDNNKRDASILKLMNVKKGMSSVNSLPDSMVKNMNAKNAANFKSEMSVFKEALISEALTTFRKKYTAEDIDFIYSEATSDKIDYSDLTNGFFRKWRQLKANLYFKKAKETYFKY